MLSADQFYRCKSLRSFSQKYWGFTAVKCFLPSFFFMLDQRVEACKLTIKKCAKCHVHCFHISNRTKRYESRYARQIVLFAFSLLLVKYALIAFTPRRTEQKKGHRASPWIQKVNLLTAAFPKILHHVQQQRRVHFAVLDSTLVRFSSKVSCSKLKSPCRVWKITPKNTPDECNEDRALRIAQKLDKNRHWAGKP